MFSQSIPISLPRFSRNLLTHFRWLFIDRGPNTKVLASDLTDIGNDEQEWGYGDPQLLCYQI